MQAQASRARPVPKLTSLASGRGRCRTSCARTAARTAARSRSASLPSCVASAPSARAVAGSSGFWHRRGSAVPRRSAAAPAALTSEAAPECRMCVRSQSSNECFGGFDTYVNVYCEGTSPQAPPPPPYPPRPPQAPPPPPHWPPLGPPPPPHSSTHTTHSSPPDFRIPVGRRRAIRPESGAILLTARSHPPRFRHLHRRHHPHRRLLLGRDVHLLARQAPVSYTHLTLPTKRIV